MENRVSNHAVSVSNSPWMAFYLASALGLLLGAFNASLAEPVAGNPPTQEIAAGKEAGGQLSGTASSNAQSGQINIPGAQSAVLTVSREIQTTAPIMNRESKGNPKKAPAPTAVSTNLKTNSGYYLQLPESKALKTQPSTSAIDVIPATAASVPVAPISPQTATSENELPQPLINLVPQADPETQPLDLSTNQSPVSGAATNAMIRVTLGLMVVLGLLLVCAKSVLPRLMARHPEFFENLKQKNQKAKTQQATYTGPIDIPQTMAEKLAAKREPIKFNLFGSRNKNKMAKITESKALAGQIEIHGKQFNVLSSTQLGKDKDLHLVEIMGRQLVVATTPYTVSLIQDLTGPQPQPADNPSDSAAGEWIETPATQLNLLANGAIEPTRTETMEEEVNITESAKPEIAPEGDAFAEALDTLMPQANRVINAKDLDDQPPPASEAEFIRAKSNPYNSVPKFSELRQLDIDTSFLEPMPLETPGIEAVYVQPSQAETQADPNRAQTDLIYRQYLEISQTENKANKVANPALENTVILNDYDDAYGY